MAYINEVTCELRVERVNNTVKPTDLSVQDTCDESRFLERSELKLKLRFTSNVKFSHLLFHVSFWNTKEAAAWD